jgi:hypothetical protein
VSYNWRLISSTWGMMSTKGNSLSEDTKAGNAREFGSGECRNHRPRSSLFFSCRFSCCFLDWELRQGKLLQCNCDVHKSGRDTTCREIADKPQGFLIVHVKLGLVNSSPVLRVPCTTLPPRRKDRVRSRDRKERDSARGGLLRVSA